MFGSNLEQSCNGEFQIAHTVLVSWIRALVARGGLLFPRVFQLVRKEQEFELLMATTPLPLTVPDTTPL